MTECSKIATGSAVMEAVLDGRAAIVEHMRDGSKPWEFEKDVWKNVAIRAAIPVPIIGPLVGSIFGMAAYGYAKRGIKARLQSKQRHTLASA